MHCREFLSRVKESPCSTYSQTKFMGQSPLLGHSYKKQTLVLQKPKCPDRSFQNNAHLFFFHFYKTPISWARIAPILNSICVILYKNVCHSGKNNTL